MRSLKELYGLAGVGQTKLAGASLPEQPEAGAYYGIPGTQPPNILTDVMAPGMWFMPGPRALRMPASIALETVGNFQRANAAGNMVGRQMSNMLYNNPFMRFRAPSGEGD